MRLISYTRVSTREQGESGLGLEAQKGTVDAYVAVSGDEIVDEVSEVVSTAKARRPLLEAALAQLARGEADGIIVAKLDRLARSTIEFAEIMQVSRKQGWAIVLLDLKIDTSTPMGEAMATVAMAFAQLERRLIGQRTQEALAVARERGVVLGRRPVGEELVERICAMRAQHLTYREIAARLNADGVPTAQGGAMWHPSTVRGIVAAAA